MANRKQPQELQRTISLEDARGAPGKRCYVVGDIHGRLDLLDALLKKIEADLKGRPVKPTYLVSLGDIIDRGPSSRQVVERLMELSLQGVVVKCVMGNHESALIRAMSGDRKILPSWLRHGGLQCAMSYGVYPHELQDQSALQMETALLQAFPREHLQFMRSMDDTLRFGDYLLVHAGIKPGLALADQAREDLHWIREEFLSAEQLHEFVVVHGHSIVPVAELRTNRIALDTGAYQSGMLTSVCLDDDERRVISVQGAVETDVVAKEYRI